jgi:molybdate transport system substrate-binding protein
MEHVFDGVVSDFAPKSSTSRCLKANALTLCAALFLLVLSTFGNAPEAQSGKVLVFAAASLKTALDEINAQWQGRTGKRAAVSYAASSALAKQIEQGAPADIFISADLDWMEYLAERKLIRPETRSDLLSNRLVLIAPKGTNLQVEIKPGLPLASLLGQGHLALANTDAVPAGKYSKAALKALGVWEQVRGRIAQAENVRAALLLVSRGEAPLGIVYESDAVSDPSVVTVGILPDATHPRITYPMALTSGSTSPDAGGFLDGLKSPQARTIFEKQGFTMLN